MDPECGDSSTATHTANCKAAVVVATTLALSGVRALIAFRARVSTDIQTIWTSKWLGQVTMKFLSSRLTQNTFTPAVAGLTLSSVVPLPQRWAAKQELRTRSTGAPSVVLYELYVLYVSYVPYAHYVPYEMYVMYVPFVPHMFARYVLYTLRSMCFLCFMLCVRYVFYVFYVLYVLCVLCVPSRSPAVIHQPPPTTLASQVRCV